MGLEIAGEYAVRRALSGEVRLLHGDVEIPRVKPVGLTLDGTPQSLRFGPAIGQDWRVTGIGVYRSGVRLLISPFKAPILVKKGRSLELVISVDVSLVN